jgi:hypothetical protein
MYPIKQAKEENKQLRNFKWLENLRPKSKFELFEDIKKPVIITDSTLLDSTLMDSTLVDSLHRDSIKVDSSKISLPKVPLKDAKKETPMELPKEKDPQKQKSLFRKPAMGIKKDSL